jgi:hypothetical protein
VKALFDPEKSSITLDSVSFQTKKQVKAITPVYLPRLSAGVIFDCREVLRNPFRQ